MHSQSWEIIENDKYIRCPLNQFRMHLPIIKVSHFTGYSDIGSKTYQNIEQNNFQRST